MNMACCLLVAAAAFTAWYRNEYIVVAHLHLLIGLSRTIIINAYLHSLASPSISNSYEPGIAYQSYVIRLLLPSDLLTDITPFTDIMGEYGGCQGQASNRVFAVWFRRCRFRPVAHQN